MRSINPYHNPTPRHKSLRARNRGFYSLATALTSLDCAPGTLDKTATRNKPGDAVISIQFPKVMNRTPFGLNLKFGYALFVFEKGMRVFHYPVVGSAISITLHINSRPLKMSFFAGCGGAWDFSKIRSKP
jgi:hypothetical protein